MADYTSDRTGASIDTVLDNADIQITPTVGSMIYHTGNTANVVFGGTLVADGTDATQINPSNFTTSAIVHSVADALNRGVVVFKNTNGTVGVIRVSGTSTSYNTSSDPRLKDFKAAPTDTEVNAKFDDLFGCFKTFNWKNDPTGDLVWGFDAHATIDAGLDMGSEGEGSRDLALGDVYKTDEAELDEDGNEIKAVIEHKVSPAGVDQSKAVPILLAKIEQLERRLKALEVIKSRKNFRGFK